MPKPMTEKERQEAELKKKISVKMFFTGIVALTIVILVVANTLGWLNNRKTGEANGVDVTVQKAPTMLIATYPTDGNWNPYLEVYAFDMTPICGDAYHFYRPVYSDAVAQVSSGVTVRQKTVTEAEDFPTENAVASCALVKEFTIRSTIADPHLYIMPTSTLLPDYEQSSSSDYNNDISTGEIAGAMRVALYAYNNTTSKYDPLAIWIPNPETQLSGSGSTWTLTDAGTPEENYYFVHEAGELGTVSSTAIAYSDAGYFDDRNNQNGLLYIWDAQKAFDDGKFVYGNMHVGADERFKLVAWVEGTDRECRNPLAGGKMLLALTFGTKEAAPSPETPENQQTPQNN